MDNAAQPPGFTNLGFVKQFVLPALTVFLAPTLAYFFFQHAEATFDADAREAILQQVAGDQSLSDDERQKAKEFFQQVPISEILTNNPELGKDLVQGEVVFHYATFRWMIRLAWWSILAGVVAIVATGVAVLFSLRSQLIQYYSLAIGWQVLRLYSALLTIATGVLLVALSFWVTALWAEMYSVKLILFAGVFAVVGVGVVLAGIFKPLQINNEIEGHVIPLEKMGTLARRLVEICQRMEVAAPDQVIAGIDANFFVTEQPLVVGEEKTPVSGRTLYISLSLLKQLDGAEADAVMAHEMAHFSGQDTYYSGKTGPLLARFDAYLHSLAEGGVTLPVFYFMNCFRAFFELSLGRKQRQREFRADRLAAEATSPDAIAGALLRIAAYARYRQKVEGELFDIDEQLAEANIQDRLDTGFPPYAIAFLGEADAAEVVTSHPFDSHPPLEERLAARDHTFHSEFSRSTLARPGDGRWLHDLPGGADAERFQWQAYEQRFREYHEQTLPYRYLPETPEEEAIVLKHFPGVTLNGKDGPLVLDHQKMTFEKWEDPVPFSEVTGMQLDDNGALQVTLSRAGKQQTRTIKTKRFNRDAQEVVETIGNYYGRYATASEYQKERAKKAEAAG